MRQLALLNLIVCAGLQAQVVIVNGASFRGDQPVTPGSWATAFLAARTIADTIAPSFPLPTQLAGVTVKIDGVEAPLYFVGARPPNLQINFVIPYQTALGLRPVAITVPATIGAAGGVVNGTVRVMTAAPGLFIKDAQSPPKGAIRNQDAVENTANNMARRGEVISIYGTGPGALDATPVDGAAVPDSPLINTRSTPQVYIGGVLATIQFSGLSPGAPSLWQINAFVPNQSFISGRTPVQVFMDGVDSNEVTVFVAP